MDLRKELYDAVIANDYEKVQDLLSVNIYDELTISGNLLTSLTNGSRNISNLLFKDIGYQTDYVLSDLGLRLAFGATYIDDILSKIFDILEHNNIVPRYAEILYIISLLNKKSDKSIAIFLEYYLNNVKLTREQYNNLLINAPKGTETSDIIKYYMQEKRKL